MVANALSRKNKATLGKPTLWEERQLAELKEMVTELGIILGGEQLALPIVQPMYQEQILQTQSSDIEGSKIRKKMKVGIETPFQVVNNGTLMMGQCLCVPDDEIVKHMVLREAHESKFTMHHGNTKMYQDLKHHYWWPNMKRKVAEYVSKCGICQ